MTAQNLSVLFPLVLDLYKKNDSKLYFHGWNHINFVHKKSLEFAKIIEADLRLVEAAALLHDLNYIVESNSSPEKGEKLRKELLKQIGMEEREMEKIEDIILKSHKGYRSSEKSVSKEVMALSDADTLYIALPITPILLTNSYLKEEGVGIESLADKIVKEQNRLMEKGVYFYTDAAKKYLHWAKTNLEHWNNVEESLKDPAVKEMLKGFTMQIN